MCYRLQHFAIWNTVRVQWIGIFIIFIIIKYRYQIVSYCPISRATRDGLPFAATYWLSIIMSTVIAFFQLSSVTKLFGLWQICASVTACNYVFISALDSILNAASQTGYYLILCTYSRSDFDSVGHTVRLHHISTISVWIPDGIALILQMLYFNLYVNTTQTFN